MLKRIVAFSVVAVATTAAPALAQQYPPEDDRVDVSAMAPCPTDTITVTAQTFAAGSTVTIELVSTDVLLGTGTADADGVMTHDVVIPDAQAPGAYDVKLSGSGADGSDVTLTAAIEVRECPVDAAPPDAAAPGGGLPVTGGDSMTLVRAGIVLAALGGLFLALARRRRHATRLAT